MANEKSDDAFNLDVLKSHSISNRVAVIMDASRVELKDYGVAYLEYRLDRAIDSLVESKTHEHHCEAKAIICDLIGSVFREWSMFYRHAKFDPGLILFVDEVPDYDSDDASLDPPGNDTESEEH